MRYLLCHSWYEYQYDVRATVESWVCNLRTAGIDVEAFCLTLNPPGPCLLWEELDRRWNRRDPELLEMYERLAKALESRDVLVNWNGINIHPEFLLQLKTFNVFGCFDDPESSELLSKPVASAYDLCMVGNIAEVDKYYTWGAKHAQFWPNGFRHYDFDPTLTKEKILNTDRSIDILLCCERQSAYRRARLDQYSEAFPKGLYFGAGWPNGFLMEEDRVPAMQDTRIGFNIHNSTGPINFRTFYLPANGVLQLCDNKAHLGRIFKLGEEVIGYDTIEEAIDITRYYLEHEEERRIIAAAGFERAHRDYNEIEVFRVLMRAVKNVIAIRESSKIDESVSAPHLTDQQYSDSMRSPNFTPWKVEAPTFSPVLEKYLPVNPEFKCLEIGGYPGAIVAWLAKRFKYTPVTIDFSEYSEHVETLFKFNGIDRYEVYQGDFFEFDHEPFDVVTSFGFVEHFQDYDSVIKRHLELVKVGGYVVIEVPRIDGLMGHITKHTFLDEHRESQFEIHNKRIMNAPELKRVLKRYGAEILYAGYAGGNLIAVDWQREVIKPEMKWMVYALNALGNSQAQSSPFLSPFAIVVAKRVGDILEDGEHELVDLFERASLLIDRGEILEAEKLLAISIEQFPDMVQPYVSMANLKIGQKNYRGALDVLLRAPLELPVGIETKKLMAEVLILLDDRATAKGILLECVLWYPEDEEILSALRALDSSIK